MTTKKTTQATIEYLENLIGGPLTLGKYLLAIREGEELTQVEFAKTLGISRQNLCHIEHERRVVSPKMAAEFAHTLGYSVPQFVRLAVQDALKRDGLHFTVELNKAA
jgi:transcriptional regulator with XRE-family HTH domain